MKIYGKGQKHLNSHSCAELSKTQFLPVIIVNNFLNSPFLESKYGVIIDISNVIIDISNVTIDHSNVIIDISNVIIDISNVITDITNSHSSRMSFIF